MSEESNASQMIQKLFQLQEERVHTFRLFEEGYKIYMASAPNYNVTKFRELVTSVTKDFKRIRAGIAQVEKQLRYDGFNSIANNIGMLQNDEESRLQVCAKLQIAKQDAIDNPHIPEKWNDVAVLKEMYNKSIQKVSDRLEELRSETQTLAC